MGSIGCCCNCCDSFVLPEGWELFGECCAVRFEEITDPFTPICSDPFRTCGKVASLDYNVYVWENPTYDCDNTGTLAETLACIELAKETACDGTESLCYTLHHEIDSFTEFRAVGQTELISIRTIASRVNCNGVCKWLFESTYDYRLMVNRVEAQRYKKFQTLNGVTITDIDIPMPTCEDLTASLSTNYLTYEYNWQLTACRRKIFDTFPTGELIDFELGDVLTCDDVVGPCDVGCTDCEGDEDVFIDDLPEEYIDIVCASCEVSPNCERVPSLNSCIVTIHFINEEVPSDDFCQEYLNGSDFNGYVDEISPCMEGVFDTGPFAFSLETLDCQTYCEGLSSIPELGPVPLKRFHKGECVDVSYTATSSGFLGSPGLQLICPTIWTVQA
jgi:hypothetical protein